MDGGTLCYATVACMIQRNRHFVYYLLLIPYIIVNHVLISLLLFHNIVASGDWLLTNPILLNGNPIDLGT